MGKSKAEYMRDYRQKKRLEKLKSGNVEPKKIARNSTQRSRDFRARAANSILSKTSTAEPTTALPNLVLSRAALRLPSSPLSSTPSTSSTTAYKTGPAEIHTRPADVKQARLEKFREGFEQVEHVVNTSTVRQYHDYQKFCTGYDQFKTKFLDNNFGAVCNVSDRLWYENNMKNLPPRARELISAEFPGLNFEKKQNSPSSGNEIKVFCPNCNTEVPHTAEGIQEDQTKILIAKVYHYFEHEYKELKKTYGDLNLTPLSKFRQRTALATGVSEMTVLQILKEEEGRNADKLQELPEKRRRAGKRFRQTDRRDCSSGEDSSDDNLHDGGESSFAQVEQNESETLVVKLEPPEYYKKQAQTYTNSAGVKAEPLDHDVNKAQKESEIDTCVVKLEPPEYYKELALTYPISAEVKVEPRDHDVNNTNETLAVNEPSGTKRNASKIPRRSDVTSTRAPNESKTLVVKLEPPDYYKQHTQGESSRTAAASSVRLTEELHESGLFGETEVKVENIEIGEEGFS